MKRNTAIGLGLVFGAYFAWGLLSPVGKILLDDFNSMELNAIRMVIGCIILFPLVGWKNVVLGMDYLRNPKLFMIVLLGGGFDFTAYMLAVEKVDATYATLGFYTAPIWTAALARVQLGERVGKWFFPAIIGLLAGGWLTLGGTTQWPAGLSAVGMMWAIGSAMGWAVYSVGLKRHAGNHRLRPLMVATFAVSAVYFIVAAAVTNQIPDVRGQSAATWSWMLVYAVVPTVVALWLFNAATKRAPASILNIFVSVELASAALFSFLLLGDRFSALQLSGLVISLVAVSGYLWSRRGVSSDAGDQQGGHHDQHDPDHGAHAVNGDFP